MTMHLTILGCASSAGVPRVGGTTLAESWGVCDPSNPKNRRRRCSVLITKLGSNGTTFCVIDTGPDFREQMLSCAVPHIDGVVYTHEHADHLHGLDDLRPYALIQRSRIIVHMDGRTYDRAKHAFGYVFQTPPGSGYPPILDRRVIEPPAPILVDGPGGAIELAPVRVKHGEGESLGFRIANTLYLPDVSEIAPETMDTFKGLDCLIIDALRHRPHVSHFNVDQALALHHQVQPKRTILTNLHNDLDYDALNLETPMQVEPAYDGLKITI